MTSSLRLRPLLLLLSLTALALTPAFAMDVQYSTMGSFSCTGVGYVCSGASLTGPNNLHITFAGQDAQFPNVSVPPASYAPFGTFTVTGELNRTATDTLPANTSFTLDIVQTLPAPGGTEVLHDTFNGTIRVGNSTVSLVFSGGTGDGGVAVLTTDPLNGAPAFKFTIAGADYFVDQTTAIHPETCANQACTAKNPGTSIINGAINTTVPEPMFYGLTGTGLAGLFVMALRRRRQAS